MAGDLRAKERAIITLTSTGASLSNASAGSATTDLDVRAAGNAADDYLARFELLCQWATVTGIAAGTIAAEIYLVPKLDGSNLPDIDTTAGASVLPGSCYVGSFIATKAPTAATNMRFVTPPLDIFPALFTAYIVNRSGQTMTANWTLRVVSAQGQYT